MENILKTLCLKAPEAIICLNGELPSLEQCSQLATQFPHIPILAADGAAAKLRDFHLQPTVIVGDLDSLANELEYWQQQPVTICHIPDQNSTDFEKCLDYALEHRFQHLLVLGADGGDLDHTLNNWSIIIRYGQHVHLTITNAGQSCVPLYESVRCSVQPQSLVSLIPQPFARLTTTGLQWNLNQELLALGIREGARNRALDANFTLVLHEGALLVLLPSVFPYVYVPSSEPCLNYPQ